MTMTVVPPPFKVYLPVLPPSVVPNLAAVLVIEVGTGGKVTCGFHFIGFSAKFTPPDISGPAEADALLTARASMTATIASTKTRFIFKIESPAEDRRYVYDLRIGKRPEPVFIRKNGTGDGKQLKTG